MSPNSTVAITISRSQRVSNDERNGKFTYIIRAYAFPNTQTDLYWNGDGLEEAFANTLKEANSIARSMVTRHTAHRLSDKG